MYGVIYASLKIASLFTRFARYVAPVPSRDYRLAPLEEDDLTVRRVYVSDRTDWFYVGKEFREYLRKCGGKIVEETALDVLSGVDCELLSDDIKKYRVSLSVEYVLNGVDYVITYPLSRPVTFPPPSSNNINSRDAIGNRILSARLVESTGEETDVTNDLALCQGPDRDFYDGVGAFQPVWTVIRYLEIRRQNKETFRLIGKRPTCGLVYHPPLDDNSDDYDSGSDTDSNLQFPPVENEPVRTLRVIFGDGNLTTFSSAEEDILCSRE
eukprot:jgi/Mesvir1/20618/Mv24182-RA.1